MDLMRPVLPIGNSTVIQFIMNVIPFLGVLFFDWSVFALIYAFWLETLGESFFNAIRITFAQNSESGSFHIGKAFSYLFVRILVLLFYLIFLLAFVGAMISGKQEGVHFVYYLFLIDMSFRITILSFFFLKFIELIYQYFYLGGRKTTTPTEYNSLFSGRIIIIHIVIVLGVFAYQFFSEKLSEHSGVVAFAAVFVCVKLIAEFIARSSVMDKIKQSQ
jgi:hypothetical protein